MDFYNIPIIFKEGLEFVYLSCQLLRKNIPKVISII